MSFAYIAVAAAVVAAGVSAAGAATQAQAAKNQNNYQAQINANNAKIAEYQRQDSINRGQEAAQQKLAQQAQLLSAQRASLAANGVDVVNSGSATDLLATTKFLGNQDVNAIQANAAREAWGYQVQKDDLKTQENLARWSASQQSPGQQAAIAGGTSLLSSVSSYAGSRASAGSTAAPSTGKSTYGVVKADFSKL